MAGRHLRWSAFRIAEEISNRRARSRQRLSRRENPAPPFAHGEASIWIYVSTIGELNALRPVLDRVCAMTAPRAVTLLTDRTIYRRAYEAAFPAAYVYELDGTAADLLALAKLTPPLALLLAEIPCFPGDAPCRLSFAAVWAARARRAPVALLNAWCYGYEPVSAIDRLERRLLTQDYLGSMDLITTQTTEVRDRLIRLGADPQAVHVAGNTKFDALQDPGPDSAGGAVSSPLLESSVNVIVAGCVTEPDEQAMIIEAFRRIAGRHNDLRLVIAPRHPEEQSVIASLAQTLEAAGIDFRLRSEELGGAPARDAQCLVLDTFGELRAIYARARVAHVGRDHNVLEPLAFRKRVTVTPGWDSRYPSYPVFQQLLQARLLSVCDNPGALVAEWERVLQAGVQAESADGLLALCGATDRNIELLAALFAARAGFEPRR